MNIVTAVNEWLLLREKLVKQTIGLVHTMGNLHEGHMSLCKRSQEENDITVAAIFINPTQFNQASDFERYPRTLEQDKHLLMQHQIDYLLLFDAQALYPDHYQIQITETELSTKLEGEHRPHHFKGMLTIVLKFLNLVQPTRSYYGEKDFQQLLLIKKMAKALFLPIEVVGCPTIRASDAVALSSRNSRLSIKQRELLAQFPRLLQSSQSIPSIIAELHLLGFKVDYIAEEWQRRLGAVWIDDIRLIDNVALDN